MELISQIVCHYQFQYLLQHLFLFWFLKVLVGLSTNAAFVILNLFRNAKDNFHPLWDKVASAERDIEVVELTGV